MTKTKQTSPSPALFDGWLPVVGGPRDGAEYYCPSDPRPGQVVNLGTMDAGGEYRVGKDCKSVEWVKS